MVEVCKIDWGLSLRWSSHKLRSVMITDNWYTAAQLNQAEICIWIFNGCVTKFSYIPNSFQSQEQLIPYLKWTYEALFITAVVFPINAFLIGFCF